MTSSKDTLQAITTRRSVRAYERQALPDEDLRAILEAARLAPSAANRQPLHLMVVRDPELKRQVAEAAGSQHFIADADTIVVGVGFPGLSPNWYTVDVAIALENLVLAAASLGYGTCWIGRFTEATIKALLELPEEARVIALMPLGVPAEQPQARSRKPWEEVFSLDHYGQKLNL